MFLAKDVLDATKPKEDSLVGSIRKYSTGVFFGSLIGGVAAKYKDKSLVMGILIGGVTGGLLAKGVDMVKNQQEINEKGG